MARKRKSSEPLLTKYTEAAIADRVEAVEPRASVEGRRPVQYVAVYAAKDESTAKALLDKLAESMRSSRFFEFLGWSALDLLPGHGLDETRAGYEEASQLILGLVSPALLGEEATMTRLTRLQADRRLLLRVPLRKVDEVHQQLGPFKGLRATPGSGKHFLACRSEDAKNDFVAALYAAIETTLKATELPTARPWPKPRLQRIVSRAFEEQAQYLDLDGYIVDTKGSLTAIRLLGIESERPAPKNDSVDAVPYLQAWACDPAAPPFFALLSETGMGKTTTCKLLARRMLDARAKDPSAPLPIYLDLRRYSWDGDPNFRLETILTIVLQKSFRSGTGAIPTSADVIEQVQQQGAAVLFDGLDEVIVHMEPKLGQDFIRELWRILPAREHGARSSGRRGKMLLSCRSHYFRRVWEQNAMLLGEEREGMRTEDYRALVLQPFTTAQIEEYLRNSIRGLDIEHALEMIRSVHNLSEMAERPFTLSLIGEFLPEIERTAKRGEEVQGVDLYKAMVTRWLLRDEGKHQFNTAHKEVLMERLAARLWSSARREWTCVELEDWLDDVLNGDDRLRGAYDAKTREVLKEDLRTATFLVRPDEESFRFAHTSLQEYFIARHLHRALREGAEDRWSMAMPSREAIEFLVQLVRGAPNERDACQKTLQAILGTYRPLGSELALRFWMEARARGLDLRRPAHIDLRGARLEEWRFAGNERRPLDLRNIDLRDAQLRAAVFEHADISGSDLSGAQAWLAEFHDVTCERVMLGTSEAAAPDLKGTLWRLSRLTGVDLTQARLERSCFIRCSLTDISWPPLGSIPILASCRDDEGAHSTLELAADKLIEFFTGHCDRVNSCAITHDGSRIVSGSSDQTLRIWDSVSGICLLIVAGHEDDVTSCVATHDGSKIVSASRDKTLRVWDIESGACLLVQENQAAIGSCAVNQDGSRIASGSRDGYLRVWDAFDGALLLAKKVHDGFINSCVFTPDGSCIVSASDDRTVRVSDAGSGELLLTLEGHHGLVHSCSISPNGSRIVSGSDDETLRIWEFSTGMCLLTMKGHQASVTSCAFNRDGSHIVSASVDKTLRVWNAYDGTQLLGIGHRHWIRSCVFSPDGSRIVSASDDNSLQVWTAGEGTRLLRLGENRHWINASAAAPDGTHFASILDNSTVSIWNVSNGERIRTLEGHNGGVRSCAFSPDGSRIVSASDDKSLRLWDASTGELIVSLDEHLGPVWACAFGPTGIVSASSDKTLRVWDAVSGRCVLKLEGHVASVYSCAVSGDGSRIVSASSDNTLRLWDTSNGACLLKLSGHHLGVTSCAVSPDGREIVSASGKTLKVWNASSGTQRLTFEGHREAIWSCAFNPDASRIVSASSDHTLRVWDAVTGTSLLTLIGHRGAVNSCAFTSDGTRIVSGSTDATVRVWDAATGAPILTIAHFDDGEHAVFDESPRRLRRASRGAWRWLGWLARDPVTGRIDRFPAESFGPLPGAE